MADVFLIDGVDYLPYVLAGGFKVTENDLDSDGSGRTLDGVMWRGKIASKKKIEVTCRSLFKSQLGDLELALSPEYVSVTYDDPKEGLVTKTMYNSARGGTCVMVYDNGISVWDDISFSLIER